ncbi:hypothetical protein GPL15_17960 [Clostridium sp. MCC353]|uniref:hypothetical protein n=1 Tax=Clostridium sp. MCC353 TaxID=2592646 RepID=UPI001C022D25|nr:hypothetical protein [Clostridium sp. MCC353]MBT9778386.1 hypothetical protein [Clostridium sp. MCC353]
MKNQLLIGTLCMCLLFPATGCGAASDIKAPSGVVEETVLTSQRKLEEDMEKATKEDIEKAAENVAEKSTEQDTEKNTKEDILQNPDQSYAELIAAATKCITNKELEIPAGFDFSTALITTGSYGTRGYLIEDIDGNGIDELIFGENGTNPDSQWDGVIFNIYTISDEELVQVLNGWERNKYFFCENGMIANEGSSGAANSNYAYFTFEGSELHLVEAVIYDGMKDAADPWFYSTESEFYSENAEPISEEKAIEIREKYIYERPEFIPFTEEN